LGCRYRRTRAGYPLPSSRRLGRVILRSFLRSPLVVVGRRADPQSVSRSWFGQRGAKSELSQDIACRVVRSGWSLNPRVVFWRLVQSVKPTHPIAVTFAASSEAVDAFPGTKRRSPGVVPNETKLALVHRASRGSSGYKIFGAVGHLCLLLVHRRMRAVCR